VANRLQVIPPRLLDSLVRGDRRIPGRASQILAIFVGDVLALAVLVALGQTKVDDVDAVTRGVRASDQEVVRLDVAMDNSLFMHLFDPLDELDGDHKDGLQVEVALAASEKILQTGPQQVHDHDVELLVGDGAVRADIVQTRHTSLASHFVNEFGLPEEHWIPLVLRCFLNFGCVETLCLLLLN